MRALRLSVIVLLAASGVSIAWSQKIIPYEGKVPIVGGDSATVRYGYLETKGQRLLHGSFQLQASTAQQHDSTVFGRVLWTGSFLRNKKEGVWNYQYQQHHIKIQSVDEFVVKTNLVSNYSVLNGRYSDGKPNGRWTFTENTYVQGVKSTILQEARFGFSNGLFSDSFESESFAMEKNSISGRFDDDGFLEGEWKFVYFDSALQITEVRQYNHGFLLSLLKTTDGNRDTLVYINFADVSEALANQTPQHENTLHDLTFDMGYGEQSHEVVSQEKGNTLLQNSIREFLFLDTAFRAPNKRVYGSARFYYAPSQQTDAQLAEVNIHLDSIEANISRVKNKNLFELSNQHSDSLSWEFEFIQQYITRLEKLKKIAAFMGSTAYAQVNPAIYLTHHANFLTQHDSIRYTFGSDERIHVLTYTQYPVVSVSALTKRLAEELMLVKNMVTSVNLELQSVLKSVQLQNLDSLILQEKHEAERWYSEVTEGPVKVLTEKIRKRFLIAEFNSLRRDYANSTDFEAKLDAGYAMYNMLGALKDFPDRINDIYILRDSIASLYTVSRLDPYTFSYVEVKVKKKLYVKIAEELFAHLITKIGESSNVNDIRKKLLQVEQLQKRLIEYRTQNTVQLERRIKANSTPEEIQALIGIL